MEIIEQLFSPQVVRALGWTLLHSLWQGAAVGLVLGVLMAFMNKHSSTVRYLVSCIALGTMVLLALGTFINLYQENVTLETALANELTTIQTAVEGQLPLMNPPAESLWTARLTWFIDYFNQHLPLIVSAWLLGVTLLMLRFLGGLAYVQRLKHYRTRAVGEEWKNIVTELLGKLEIGRRVQVFESAAVAVPMVIGHFKPVVLIPMSVMTGLTPRQIEAVLAHELAHIARHDYLVNILQTVSDIVFFYHPVMWWISASVRTERENCCDDLAISVNQDCLVLAKTLADLESVRQQQGAWATPSLAMAFNGQRKGQLFQRIERLFDGRRRSTNFREGFIAAIVLVISLLSMSFASRQNLPQSAEAEVETPAPFIWQVTPTVAATDSPAVPPTPAAPIAPASPTAPIASQVPEAVAVTVPSVSVWASSAPVVATYPSGSAYTYTAGTPVAPSPKFYFHQAQDGTITISKQLDDGRYLFARTDADGKIKELFVEGKKVPAKDYPLYQPVIDKELAARKNTNFHVYPTPRVQVAPMPPMPAMPDLAPLFEGLAPLMDMSLNLPEGFILMGDSLIKFKGNNFYFNGDSARVFEWREGMHEWADEWREAVEEQKELEREMRNAQREHQEEYNARMREIQQEMRALELERQARMREAQAEFHRQQAERMREEADKHRETSNQLQKRLQTEMEKDGLIKAGQKDFSLKLSAKELIINKVKQPDAIFQRYKKIIEEELGHPIDKDTNFQWNWTED